MRGRAIRGLAAALLAAVLGCSGAAAQSLTAIGSGEGPLEITADEGIEWRRSEGYYLARGNAVARRGEILVRAEELRAYIEGEDLDGLSRIEALGGVRIETPRETASGQKAVYEVTSGKLILTGDNLRLVTERETLTATRSLEYDEPGRRAVARGDATLRRADQRLTAELLEAFLAEGQDGNLAILRVEGTGGVEIATPTEFVSGAEGVYFVDRDFATLAGGVKITRGETQLNGEYAEVDLKAGVSRLLARPPEGTDGGDAPTRVRGLLVPDDLGRGKRPGDEGEAAGQ